MDMKISIITVCHKSKEKILRYVETFLEHHRYAGSSNYEFIFVENSGEIDFAASVQPLLKNGFEVKIICTENEGFGVGCNRGAGLATGDILVFANPDIEFMTKLDALNLVERQEWWGTCRQLDGKSRVGGLDIFPECKKTWHEFVRFHRFVNVFPSWFGSKLYVVGSFLIVTVDIFRRTKGFDSRFFLYYEEAEFGRRLNKTIGPPVQLSNIVITHVGFGSHENKSSIYEHEANGFLTYCQVTMQPWLIARKIKTLGAVSRFSQGAKIRLEVLKSKIINDFK